MCNNPKVDHVNINVHTKFSKILFGISQDIERKQNYDGQTDGTMETQNDRQPKSNIALTFSKLGYNYRLMQVKSIAECSKGGILQYF